MCEVRASFDAVEKEVDVVVLVGYEGIERVIWATTSPEEAVKVVRELREAIREFYEIWEKGLNDAKESRETEENEAIEIAAEKAVEAVLELFKGRDLFYVYKEVIELAEFVDPNRICVQKFDIKSGGFRCFCNEMGVGVGRKILY